MGEKILGKYEIIDPKDDKEFGENEFKAKTAKGHFYLKRVAKNGKQTKNEDKDSTKSIDLMSLAASLHLELDHKNIKCVTVDEDDFYFYAITPLLESEEYFPLKRDVFIEDEELNYEKLINCYVQIFDALKYIDSQNLHHANICTQTVLVDRDNRVFLLDFGKSYYYGLFGSGNTRFHAPEQLGLLKEDIDIRADIFAFGLVMLDLLLAGFEGFDFNEYKAPKDLEGIFEKIVAEYELEGVENELFLLIKKMIAYEPQKRISLQDLGEELRKIYTSLPKEYVFELNLSEKAAIKYGLLNELDPYELAAKLEERLSGQEAFFEFSKDKSEEKEEIRIACADLIFCCSAKEAPYFFCFAILDNNGKMLDALYNNGVKISCEFKITTRTNHCYECSDVQSFKEELEEKFRLSSLKAKFLEVDKRAIATEEELLAAEKRSIDAKKQTQDARFKSLNRNKDSMVFTLIKEGENYDNKGLNSKADEALNSKIEQGLNSSKSEEGLNSKDNKSLNLEADEKEVEILNDNEGFSRLLDKFQGKEENLAKEKGSLKSNQKFRGFRLKDRVIVEDEEEKFKGVLSGGEVIGENANTNELTIKFARYSLNTVYEELLKKARWKISYDYQIEEILWSKKNKALEALGNANVLINNLLRKINNPKVLAENDLVDEASFFDKNLDENQKEVTIKALSLENESEILLIQGPPGTGKTTVITELIRKFLKRHRNIRILLASQSNQAVDNVLEKLYKDETKILRIGNEDKMSDIAKNFTNKNVLYSIIKDNLDSLKKNKICDENLHTQEKLRKLQEDFKKSLQLIHKLTIDSKGELGQLIHKLYTKSRDGELGDLFLKNIRCFFGTLLGISSWENFKDTSFDIAIVDEAGRATLSEILVPCIKARKIVLVGDHKQLAPVVDDEIADNIKNASKEEVKTSFFERLWQRLEEGAKDAPHLKNFKHRLTYNYRAEDRICRLYSTAFYEGELKTSDAIKDKREHGLNLFKSSVVWLDTSKRADREDSQAGTGKINICNKDLIKRTLEILHDKLQKEDRALSIGIITPYKAQVNLLTSELKALKERFKELYKDKTYDKDLKSGFDIGTVDSFQGSDRDIIIYDCVRSGMANKDKKGGAKISFIADEKRLNVSLSRAKSLLIIVGDMNFLFNARVDEGKNNPFYEIISYINKHKEDYQIIGAKNG